VPNLLDGLSHPWLQNAFCGAAIVAILAAVVGYFVVMRGASFATHALSQIGFAGAAGAVLLGIEPLIGLIAFSLAGALGLGALATRTRSSDVPTALVLVCALGTGALFLALANSFGSDAMSFLFGTIVGVDREQVAITFVAAVGALALLASIARPLLFATIAPDAARAAGVRVGTLDLAFLGIIGLAAAITVPIVGPAAAASRLTARPSVAVAIAVLFGLVAVALGVALAYETDWPVGFFIAAIAMLEYLGAGAYASRNSP
jgi:zinc/manganese transport system permease protein